MRGLRGGLRSGLHGPLRGFGAGGSSLPGGTLAAVSGPGTFEAVGGLWTLGDLASEAWFLPSVASGITLGATVATIPTVDAWATLTELVRTTEGAWTCLTNDAGESAVDRLSQTAVTNYLAEAPMGVTIDLRRGAPSPGEASNLVRVYSGTAYVDINLDTGAVAGGTHETCTITALGASPDDGYTVAPRFPYPGAAATIGLAPLVGDSSTFADAEGEGYFYAKGGVPIQPRVASWESAFDPDYSFATGTAAKQPVLWEDARGPCVVFTPASVLMGSAAVIAMAHGAYKPISVAMALDGVADDTARCWLTWRQSNGSVGSQLAVFGTSSTGVVEIYENASASAGYSRVAEVGYPFAGVVVARSGATLLQMRYGGSNSSPNERAADRDRTITLAYLGYSVVGGLGNGRLREMAIATREWTDVETAAADAALRVKWGY